MIEVMGFINEGDIDLISERPTHESGSGSRGTTDEDGTSEFFRSFSHSEFRLMIWAGTVQIRPKDSQDR